MIKGVKVFRRIVFKLNSVWHLGIAAEKQHSLEQLQNYLLHKRYREDTSSNSSQSPPHVTSNVTEMLLSSQSCQYLSGAGSPHIHTVKDDRKIMSQHLQSPSPSPSPELVRLRKDIAAAEDTIVISESQPNSLFTIDSILASPKCNRANINSPSPGSATTERSLNTSTLQTNRNIPALLHHHPGLHLTQLAAAASGFGAAPDFLGKKFRKEM